MKISVEATNLALKKFETEFEELRQKYLSTPFKKEDK